MKAANFAYCLQTAHEILFDVTSRPPLARSLRAQTGSRRNSSRVCLSTTDNRSFSCCHPATGGKRPRSSSTKSMSRVTLDLAEHRARDA
eukprot:8302593-Pyramimonas_sp.AAC.1